MDWLDELYNADSINEIFRLVKRVVYIHLGISRGGISLMLEDLPISILGYHAYSTNFIVLNRRIYQAGERIRDKKLFNSFIFVVLLHEYLHTLGILDESYVRKIVRDITAKFFGRDSLPHRFSIKPLDKTIFEEALKERNLGRLELVKDFGSDDINYIA